MNTYHHLLAGKNARLTWTRVDSNPHMENSATMDHYRCTISMLAPDRTTMSGVKPKKIAVIFSKGIGHKGQPPELIEVLDCLASDAAGVENARSFAEWCGEYGYDTDSRKAFQTYEACKETCAKLKRLFGDSYEKLLFETERL